jgi:hypothetical protein
MNRKGLIALAAAIGVALASAAVALTAHTGDESLDARVQGPPRSTRSTWEDPGAIEPKVGPVGTPGRNISMRVGYPGPLLSDGKTVWFSFGLKDAKIGRIEQGTMTLESITTVFPGPRHPSTTLRVNGLAFARSSVWAAVQKTIIVAAYPQGQGSGGHEPPESIDTSFTGIVRFDRSTGARSQAVKMQEPPSGIAFASGSLWVTAPMNVYRFDESGRLIARIPLRYAASLRESQGELYSTANSRYIAEIDPSTNTVRRTLRAPFTLGSLDIDDGNLFAVGADRAVAARVDIGRWRLAEQHSLPAPGWRVALHHGRYYLAPGPGSPRPRVITVVDLQGRVLREFNIGDGVTSIAVDDDYLWATQGSMRLVGFRL